MEIKVVNKRRSIEKIKTDHPDAIIIDVTSKSTDEFVQLSPFYPHGDIPIPFSNGITAQSVEGIWQGLKVFEKQGIDHSKFNITNMKGIKRSTRKLGLVLGHQRGLESHSLLDYYQARLQIYIPSYEWVLRHKTTSLIDKLSNIHQTKVIILLDYETNCQIDNLSSPLSHAALIKNYIERGIPKMRSH